MFIKADKIDKPYEHIVTVTLISINKDSICYIEYPNTDLGRVTAKLYFNNGSFIFVENSNDLL